MLRTGGLKTFVLLGIALFLCGSATTRAATIGLQNATATFSQSAVGYPISEAIDGSFDSGSNGWAVFNTDTSSTDAQTAAFETVSDVGTIAGTTLTFSLHHLQSFGGHSIGRFRLSATTDNRDDFADGLQSGGDVTANWTELSPDSATSSSGELLSVLGDNSILAGGINPVTSVYTVTAVTGLVGITGFRLEVLLDPSLPTEGPGRYEGNGNFVLTEFEVDAVSAAVPEPSSMSLAGLGLLGLIGGWRRARQARRAE